jgi:hypothetical protein
MATQHQPLNERAQKFKDLSAGFFAQVRSDFLSKVDKDKAVMNLKEFLDKLSKVDVSKLDEKSKVVFDKLVHEPAKSDQLLSTAHNILQVLANKEKISYDQAKVLLAVSFDRLKDFVAKLEKEIPGIIDEIKKL